MVRATSRESCATAADSGGGGALIHGVQQEGEPRTDREDPSLILKYRHLPPPPPPASSALVIDSSARRSIRQTGRLWGGGLPGQERTKGGHL